jgi:hypothetical protein
VSSRDAVLGPTVKRINAHEYKIDFNFLDQDDWIIIEVMHTGENPGQCTLNGTIIECRKGIRRDERPDSKKKFEFLLIGLSVALVVTTLSTLNLFGMLDLPTSLADLWHGMIAKPHSYVVRFLSYAFAFVGLTFIAILRRISYRAIPWGILSPAGDNPEATVNTRNTQKHSSVDLVNAEKRNLNPQQPDIRDLTIDSASYGASDKFVDVTDILTSMIGDNHLSVIASNDLGGDPFYGRRKKLIVNYSYKGQRRTVEVKEDQTLSLP